MTNNPSEPVEVPDDLAVIAKLESLAVILRRGKSGRVLSVDFRECQVTIDDAIASELIKLPRLKEIFLDGTAISNDTIAAITKLPRLSVFSAENTSLTDDCIGCFIDCKKLTLLRITGTHVSREKVAELRKMMINARIVFRT